MVDMVTAVRHTVTIGYSSNSPGDVGALALQLWSSGGQHVLVTNPGLRAGVAVIDLRQLTGGGAPVPGGRPQRRTYGEYAATPAAVADMLERAVADMQARAARFAGYQRDHTPTPEDPFTVVLVDEVAFLTAYQPDRKMRERIMNALATLTTQGRAVGYCVVAALQDPRKDVLSIRDLFPDRIAMRLDEPEQTDMVLSDGARDRGAACELISTNPATGAGVAFIRLESDPDPVRLRAGWVSDPDIRGLAAACCADTMPLELEGVPA
jgi:S-DNA-T family DNA segregation ATPase FtsK/SpoIIIE